MMRMCVTFLSLVSLAAGQSQKLSLPLPLDPAAAGGDVSTFLLTSDDLTVVYLAREAGDRRVELRSRPLDGSRPSVRLTAEVPAAEGIGHSLFLTPDGKRVVFLTSQSFESDDSFQWIQRLYSVPVAGGEKPRLLADAIGLLESDLALSPDGGWIVYTILEEEAVRVMGVPTDGHRDAVELLARDSWDLPLLVLTERRMLYSEPSASGGLELWAIDLSGANRAPLSGPLVAGGYVRSFEATADGAHVVYRADQLEPGVAELFVVPADGSAVPRRVNPPLVERGNVSAFALSPDSTRVVYRASQEQFRLHELYVAPLDGSAPPVKVSGTSPSGAGSVQLGARFSLDGQRVVYPRELVPDVVQLFSAPADGSAAPVLVSGPMVSAGDVQVTFLLSRPHLFLGAGERVVYLADAESDGVVELFSAPLDGAAAPTRLSGDLVPGGDVLEFLPTADGTRVLFQADAETDQALELYSVPVEGGPRTRLARSSLAIDTRFAFAATRDGARVLYRADEGTPGFFELFQRQADGSVVTVNGPLSAGNVQGDVRLFAEDPDSGRLVYAGDQFSARQDALISVQSDGPRAHVQIDELSRSSSRFDVWTLVRGRLLYIRPQPTGGVLHVAPSDGTSAPLALSGALQVPGFQGNLRPSPDGTQVAFYARTESGGPARLFGVPLDGSRPPVDLSGPLVEYGNIEAGFSVTPEGTRVLYRADARAADTVELFVVPLAGGEPPIRLSGEMVAGGDVLVDHAYDVPPITPDGRFVVYRADARVDEQRELFRAPLDGSAPPELVSGPLQADGDVLPFFRLDPTGRRVVYRADAFVDERFELFSVALEGGAAPVRLSPDLGLGGLVDQFAFTPDGLHVVHRTDVDGDGRHELFVTPSGGGRPRRLDAGDSSVVDFVLDPGATTVVYRTLLDDEPTFGLLAVPLDGTRPPLRLDLGTPRKGLIGTPVFTRDGKRLLCLADVFRPGVLEVMDVPLDGGRPPVRRNAPLSPGREVRAFQPSTDGRSLFYVADQEEDEVFELYRTDLNSPGSARRR